MKTKLIITCEHASNVIPIRYEPLFSENQTVLKSHRAYDIGANELFGGLIKDLQPDYSAKGKYSRLLVELNRSLHHRNIFSEFTNQLNKKEKAIVINNYYIPYRSEIESIIEDYLKNNFKVLHLSIHSFTPSLNGLERNAEIGILYDPKNETERGFANLWKSYFLQHFGDYNIRFNYPYLGTADGFTTHLRKKFPVNYAGLELEMNNKLTHEYDWKLIQHELINSTKMTLSSFYES
jgi:predicted N-formylglutamate amidohydrolase